jgi:alpha-amylase/alpha-mannosidase (GH57 family)
MRGRLDFPTMTKVAILWHMHQPHYGDADTGEQVLPWVRLHALKDYFGMVELLREFPDVRLTFNLVPSLIVQLDALAAGTTRDRYQDLGMKPAATLSSEEREFLVANAFLAQRARMIEPSPRYRELLAQREEAAPGAGEAPWRAIVARFSEADLRDLQVWQTLAWVDRFYQSDPRVVALHDKGRGFSEDDKQQLAVVEREILRRVIPAYREAAGRGQVELSTSPFYHPILPLLCDTDLYARMHPDARVTPPFQHPEDAAAQLERGIRCHETYLGDRPHGFWPPEGSVSEAIVPLAAAARLAWMATDEAILARTLGVQFARDWGGHLEQPDVLYRPYRVRIGDAEVRCLFRDHVLSDLIGFTYSSWPHDAAAQDLVWRITEAGTRYATRTGGGEATIGIILDGENAWEHYDQNGRPFLRHLYHLLSTTPGIRTVTMSEATRDASETLASLAPGSWAGGDFYIWIGHPDDRKGWSQLVGAHQALDEAGPGVDAAARDKARESLFIAEGSDWFWWYGDDHSSDQDLEFDTLFRSHVQAVYKTLGLAVPESLLCTNITAGLKSVDVVQPSGPVHSALDGGGDEAGWASAGFLRFRQFSGTMRQSVTDTETRVAAIKFGFGDRGLFLRVDTSGRVDDLLGSGATLTVGFLQPAGFRLRVRAASGGAACAWETRAVDGDWVARPDANVRVAAGAVLEARIPLDILERRRGALIRFYVGLSRGGIETSRSPAHVPVATWTPDHE